MTPSDDDIRAMLAGRADRVRTGGSEAEAVLAAARSLAAAEPRAARRRLRSAGWTPRLAGGLASLAAVALAFVVLAVPLLSRPPASGEPTSAPSAGGTQPTTSPAPSDATDIDAITAQELQALVDARGTELVGRTFAVEGTLESNPSCAGRTSCADAIVGGTSLPVQPVGDIGPGPWDGSGPITGTFALRLVAIRGAPQGVVAHYLGDIRRGPDGLVWPLADIIGGASREETGLVAVRGWIVRSPLHPCPTRGDSPPNTLPNTQSRAEFGCPSDDWLSVEKFQPLRSDGSSITPAATDAIYLWSGTYDEWAPDPAPFGTGVEPREGTFLLSWTAVASCGPLADCAIRPTDFHWIVRGRLDPLPPATGPTDEPAPTTGYYPGGVPIAVDGQPVSVGFETQRRLANATDDTPFLAGGFAVQGPFLCLGGIGPSDPNPLGGRGCPTYQISGIPGRLFVPERLEMPQGDTPIVVRVHTRDPGAETCWPQTIASCRTRVVVEAVVWTGDATTRATPLGPSAAIADVLSIAIADNRVMGDNTTNYVSEARFVVPITCEAPFPPILYAVRGDPRLGLLAVFSDKATRASFQDSIEPATGANCLDVPIDRPEAPRWIGHENILVLAYADDATATEFAGQLAWTAGQRNLIPLPDASIDRSRETLLDYLAMRAAGPSVSGEVPLLSFGTVPENPDGNPAIDVDAGWTQDAVRRYETNALDGVIELITTTPSREQLGDAAAILEAAGSAELWLYWVSYPAATDQRLASETFVVYHTPGSTFRDWGIARASGEPFPIVPIPPQVDTSGPGIVDPELIEPIDSGSGDTPCLPAGQECG